MNLNVSRAIQLPFKGQGWWLKVLIGAVLWVAAALLTRHAGILGQILHTIVGALTVGYSVRVMQNETRNAANAPALLPEWDNVMNLLERGLLLMIANGIYTLLFGTFVFVTSMLFGVGGAITAAVDAHSAAPLLAGMGLVWVIVMAVSTLLYALFTPLMAAHYAHEERYGALIEVGTVLRKIFSRPGNTLIASLVSLMVVALAVVLSLTVIGAPFAAFMAQVTLANLWAQVYRQN